MMAALVEDLQHEVLEQNAAAMRHSHRGAHADAIRLLEVAFVRLNSDGDTAVREAGEELIDRLKATTLNNLGVVECHQRELERSLARLREARALEEKRSGVSATTALNLCATYNAHGQYEEAVEAAAAAVRALMRENDGKPTEANKVQWAAAWHNFAVAEVNLIAPPSMHTAGDRPRTHSDDQHRAAVLNIFRNAMRSADDLLGPGHPLTSTVHESYRAARATLRAQGAFSTRQNVVMLPAVKRATGRGSARGATNPYDSNRLLTADEALGVLPPYQGARDGAQTGHFPGTRPGPSLFQAVRSGRDASIARDRVRQQLIASTSARTTNTLQLAEPIYLDDLQPPSIATPKYLAPIEGPPPAAEVATTSHGPLPQTARAKPKPQPPAQPQRQPQHAASARLPHPPAAPSGIRSTTLSATTKGNTTTGVPPAAAAPAPPRKALKPAVPKAPVAAAASTATPVSAAGSRPGTTTSATRLGDMWVESTVAPDANADPVVEGPAPIVVLPPRPPSQSRHAPQQPPQPQPQRPTIMQQQQQQDLPQRAASTPGTPMYPPPTAPAQSTQPQPQPQPEGPRAVSQLLGISRIQSTTMYLGAASPDGAAAVTRASAASGSGGNGEAGANHNFAFADGSTVEAMASFRKRPLAPRAVASGPVGVMPSELTSSSSSGGSATAVDTDARLFLQPSGPLEPLPSFRRVPLPQRRMVPAHAVEESEGGEATPTPPAVVTPPVSTPDGQDESVGPSDGSQGRPGPLELLREALGSRMAEYPGLAVLSAAHGMPTPTPSTPTATAVEDEL